MRKKIFAIIGVVLAIALVIGLGALLYNTLSKDDDSSSSDIPAISGANQPPANNTKNTNADMLVAIANAKKTNPDTIGWIKIPGTKIDNSILQSHNNDYYLRLTEEKKPDVYGCYFLDYECFTGTREQLSRSSVIYGHSDLENNPEGFRFSQLFKFNDVAFAQNTPYIYYATAEEYMVWQVMAVFYTDTKLDYININAEDQNFLNIVDTALARSIYIYEDFAFDISTDKMLFLSTCSAKAGRTDERFVVMAKLVPADAELLAKATFSVNQNPQQPDFS